MKESQIRRSMPLFSIGTVMKLTGLSARQIRYYEEHQLISPARSDGKHRLFSLNDIDKLLEIKDLLNQGLNIAGIKEVFSLKEEQKEKLDRIEKEKKEITENELRKRLREETLHLGKNYQFSIRQGELSRFLH
ncbi:MerR family transcriptional regulator [Caldibacillus debilis]|uniref:HTH merR-type domain-containing protein n=3 Tax=Caldibacillus debilis TaxID=301148 RepID=A0A150L8N6_9BACI|nr:MerR family transcriptional regulator [Caldibacillus debilis]KYD08346.1 hypothetical protein B4135_4057 [Caldibacillus debilis]OUM91986.1 MAG: transcriptional regulator [Caldibacillus debilis]RKO61138.1 putative transcriptional regulator [Caldibacillus debilis GB1]